VHVHEPEQVGVVGGAQPTLDEDGRRLAVSRRLGRLAVVPRRCGRLAVVSRCLRHLAPDAHRVDDVIGVGSWPLLAHESDERLPPVEGPVGTALDESGCEEGTQAVVVTGVDGLVVRHRYVATVHTAPFVGGRMNRSVHVMTTV